jgi:tetratricopeptide (TPR) repeat protein
MTPRRSTPVLAGLALLLGLAQPGAAVTHLKHGDQPPPLALATLDGDRVSLADHRGEAIVVVFGELYHEKTLQACGALRRVLAADAMASFPVATLLVIAQDAPVDELRARADDPRLPPTILHDVDRTAYGDYRVAVMPSVVIVDADGRVVHAVAGYTARFGDIVADALLVAAGALDYERFAERLHPAAEPVDEAVVRAGRITNLARQLARRGLRTLAQEKYHEALELAPDHAPARLGLAMTLLETRRLSDAEREFRAALEASPELLEASLGLAYVQTLRGGDELSEAAGALERLLRDHPNEPRAHYLLGLVHQQRDESDEAIASLRRSAELMMSRRDAWTVVPAGEESR